MSKSSLTSKIVSVALRLFPLLFFVAIGVPLIGVVQNEASKIFGLKPLPVPVVGTGSMYPSLFWATSEGGPEDESRELIEEYRRTPHLYLRFDGLTLLGQTFGRRSVGRGDMVAFQSDKTMEILTEEGKNPEAGFIKRVIGIPGDKIELRDGFVYRNGDLIDEPYISAPRSTYGGDSLTDCVELTVGDQQYFVLGDNRKVSSDSRFGLGLVSDRDIQYLLPYAEQAVYFSLYRDTANDSKLLGEPSLNSQDFLRLVNDKRASSGLPALSLSDKLVRSSSLRADKLLQNKDTSFGLKQALESAGYNNRVMGEFVSYGHFSASELLENLLYNNGTAKQILSREYSDLGIAVVNKLVEGCPSQVIVGHLGGYVPPEYSESIRESWGQLETNLREVIPTWEKAVGSDYLNQSDLNELLTILRRRLVLASEIVSAIGKREWLSDDQERRIKDDQGDSRRAEELATKLNRD